MRASLILLTLALFPFVASAAEKAPPKPADIVMTLAYLGVDEDPREPLSFIEGPVVDEGFLGAQLGVADDNTTGRLLKQSFKLDQVRVAPDGDFAKAAKDLVASGHGVILADLPADKLLAIADLPETKDALIFNIRAKDEALRNQQCRANVFHTAPSRYMLADALAQYLIKMRWNKWFLVVGQGANDKLYAEAIKRSAKRYNAKIVTEKEWTFSAGSKRADDGHVSEQQEIPNFTQSSDYDVLIVADEGDNFGEYLPYHTYQPRPVAGTHGMMPVAWYRTNEAWGATQFHGRFERTAHRWMTERDYAGWVAARAIGETLTRIRTTDLAKIREFLLSPDFAISAFMGTGASFRSWDHQMRQQILLTGPRMLVSVSPQAGFLHEFDTLDTLGTDKPESACKFTH